MSDAVDRLLAEQLSYYRARAGEYVQTAFVELSEQEMELAARELQDAIDGFGPTGNVLELACGPGTWTPQLLRHATTLTALDGSPEMLALAQSKIGDAPVRFVQADIFAWRPDQGYDVVFFGFWLSHVPLERFESFWKLVRDCLKPAGRVLFVDDAFRVPEELMEGEQSAVIRRRLVDGTPFRAVKVPHTPQALQSRLADLGWEIEVNSATGPFYWGAGKLRSTA
jgi:demethylmenaquinone methyltransferase/2-methoxy-6-polyprenyl-1,4-benzoquinol methylase